MKNEPIYPDLDHQGSLRALKARNLRTHLNETQTRSLVASPTDDTIFRRIVGLIGTITALFALPALLFSEMSAPLIAAVFIYLMIACAALAPPRYESAYLTDDIHLLLVSERARTSPSSETISIRTAWSGSRWKDDEYSATTVSKYSAEDTKHLFTQACERFGVS